MDVNTLIFANFLSALSMVAMFSLLAIFRKETSIRYFALSYLLIPVAYLLYMLPIPVELHALEVVHLLLTNLALLSSNLLLNSSFRVFCKIEPWPRRNWIYLAVFLILNWYYYALEPSYLIRASVFSVVAILFLIDLLLSTVILIPKSIGFLRSLLIFLCVEYAIVHLVRIVLLLVYSRQSMDWIENNPANLFMPAATLFNVVIWATVLLLLEFYRTSEQLKSQNETLESLATIDPLTGLRNRNDFSKNLDHMIEVADRYEEPISMILLDFDHFKEVNDKYGHDGGDRVLKSVATLFPSVLRNSDLAIRWGGEEFLIVLPNTTLDGARSVAEKMRASIELNPIEGVGKVTASFGVASHSRYEVQESWFKKADLSLYRAKQNGRNCVVCWDEKDMLPLAMIRLEWQPRWNSGNAVIDQEHQELLALGNQLIDLQLAMASQAELTKLIGQLKDHLTLHFQHEEEILSKLGYQLLDHHHKEHEELLLTIHDMKLSKDASVDLTSIFHLVMGKIIIGHLLTDDVAYFDLTRSHK